MIMVNVPGTLWNQMVISLDNTKGREITKVANQSMNKKTVRIIHAVRIIQKTAPERTIDY